MVIICDLDGEVKSIPSAISQGETMHDVTIVAPFSTSTCVLKIKPPSEEWTEDALTVANTTSDGEGAIFTTELPPSVSLLPGRLMYQLEFTGQDATVKKSKVGSISISPSVLTEIPETAEDLSQYSLSQIYAMLASFSNSVRSFRKTIGLMKTAVPVSVTIPPSSWTKEKTAVIPVDDLSEDNIVIFSFLPSQHEIFADCGILCTDKGNGYITVSCEEIPDQNVDIQLLIFAEIDVAEEGGDTPPEEPDTTLTTPVISISGDTLTVSNVAYATGYEITARKETAFAETVIYSGSATAHDLKTLLADNSFASGRYFIRSRAMRVDGNGTTYSAYSNKILYVYTVANVDEYINAPVIAISENELTIYPQGGNVHTDHYAVLADNVLVDNVTEKTVNLRNLLKNAPYSDFAHKTYSITCRAVNAGSEIVSNHSNAIRYAYEEPYVNAPTVALSGENLIITQAATQGTVPVAQYQLIVGGEHYGYYSPTAVSISLSSLRLNPGTYDIWINARNDEEGVTPAQSNVVRYAVGMTVSLTLSDRSYMGETMWIYINKNAAEVGYPAYKDAEWVTSEATTLTLNEGDDVKICNAYSDISLYVEKTANCSASELTVDGRRYIRIVGFTAKTASVEIMFT